MGLVTPDGRQVKTPDLRGVFIIGASDVYPPDSTGGSVTETSSSNGDHVHAQGNTGATTLTVDQIPSHGHTIRGGSGTTRGLLAQVPFVLGGADDMGWGGIGSSIGLMGGGEPHAHTNPNTASSGAHTHTTNIIPPYYALAYIKAL